MWLLHLDNIVYDGTPCNNSFFAIRVAILDYRRRGRFRRRVRRLSGGHASCWQYICTSRYSTFFVKQIDRWTTTIWRHNHWSPHSYHWYVCMMSSNPNVSRAKLISEFSIFAQCNNNNLFPNYTTSSCLLRSEIENKYYCTQQTNKQTKRTSSQQSHWRAE